MMVMMISSTELESQLRDSSLPARLGRQQVTCQVLCVGFSLSIDRSRRPEVFPIVERSETV